MTHKNDPPGPQGQDPHSHRDEVSQRLDGTAANAVLEILQGKRLEQASRDALRALADVGARWTLAQNVPTVASFFSRMATHPDTGTQNPTAWAAAVGTLAALASKEGNPFPTQITADIFKAHDAHINPIKRYRSNPKWRRRS